jgi:outer membrane protein assembly factor BamB
VRVDGTPWREGELERIREADPLLPDEEVSGRITSLAFSPDGSRLAVGAENPEVVVLDASTGEVERRWLASEFGWVNGVTFAGNDAVATGGDDGRVVLWDATSGEARWEDRRVPAISDLRDWTAGVLRVAASPDGRRLASTVGGQVPVVVHVDDLATGARIWNEQDDLWFSELAWSPDSRLLATAGRQSGDLVLRDGATGRRIGEPAQASSGPVHTVEFAADNIVVTAGGDGTVRLWEPTNLRQIGANIPAVDNLPAFAHVTADGRRILVLAIAGRAWVWDLDPASWARQACSVANRNLTESEWAAFLPGRPYEPTCP